VLTGVLEPYRARTPLVVVLAPSSPVQVGGFGLPFAMTRREAGAAGDSAGGSTTEVALTAMTWCHDRTYNMDPNDDTPPAPALVHPTTSTPTVPVLPDSRRTDVHVDDRLMYLDVSVVEKSVERVKQGLTTAAQELAWQLESQVWVVMGFDDWPAFQLAMYGQEFVALVKREERSWFVAELLMAGSTQAQAAKALGVSQVTVNHDYQVIGSDNPEAAAAIEAQPHLEVGSPRGTLGRRSPRSPRFLQVRRATPASGWSRTSSAALKATLSGLIEGSEACTG
jgi:hypothetical protein